MFGSTMHVWSDLFFALLVPLLPFIKEDMGLSFTEVGLLRSVFSGASAVLQVPCGVFGREYGRVLAADSGECLGVGRAGGYGSVAGIPGVGGGVRHRRAGRRDSAPARVQHGVARLRRQGAGDRRRDGQLRRRSGQDDRATGGRTDCDQHGLAGDLHDSRAGGAGVHVRLDAHETHGGHRQAALASSESASDDSPAFGCTNPTPRWLASSR